MFQLGLKDKFNLFKQPSIVNWVIKTNTFFEVLVPKICAADDLTIDWNNQNQLEFIDQSLDIFDDFSHDLFYKKSYNQPNLISNNINQNINNNHHHQQNNTTINNNHHHQQNNNTINNNHHQHQHQNNNSNSSNNNSNNNINQHNHSPHGSGNSHSTMTSVASNSGHPIACSNPITINSNLLFDFNYSYSQPLFNDFLPLNSDIFPSSVSSIETLSPLDEELFKKKKEKVEQIEKIVPNNISENAIINPSFSYSRKRNFDDFEKNDCKKIKSNLSNERIRYELDNYQENMKFSSSSKFSPFNIKLESDLDVSPPNFQPNFNELHNNNSNIKNNTTTNNHDNKFDQPKQKLTSFDCIHCNASFKVKGYLTRHLKKHNSSKAFICPFYQKSGILGTKCHPTGGFSRRDTFKTHLKALHFIYPPGTKSNERNSISGRCAGCFEYFNNNFDWLINHIEAGVCTGTVIARKDNHD